MKKIEIVWREILEKAPKNPVFQQNTLAEKFKISTSTVSAAVTPLKNIGAISVTGKNFRVTNFEKILIFWATHRNLNKDIIYRTYVNLPVLEIEGLVDNKTVFGGYSAGRMQLMESPSDYDKVYIYHPEPKIMEKRFPKMDKNPNFFILKPDPFLTMYGKTTSPSQTYSDIWNLPDWYASDFLTALKEKYYGFLQ